MEDTIVLIQHLHDLSDGVFRESYSSVMASGGVPSIPVQPIGYGDAIYFMRYHCSYFFHAINGIFCSQLDNISAPNSWIGGLNVSYRIWQSDSNTKYAQFILNLFI